MIDSRNDFKYIWYFGLEPVKARYTEQLSTQWIPDAFAEHDNVKLMPIPGNFYDNQQINVGQVLDATGRGKFALSQCQNFLLRLEHGEVQNGDVLYFQDFWHPGIESIFYALDMYDIKVDIYSMLHAQSVDEYDFTYPMRDWMRPFELGIDKRMAGIFVGSTIHRDQLRAAGFQSKIHVVSLPFGKQQTLNLVPSGVEKINQVIFASRLDKEKNPYFLLKVIDQFLKKHEDWIWAITTSGKEFKSNLPGVIEMFEAYSKNNPRLRLYSDLGKVDYYTMIAKSKIMFNCSLQDYVSWTSIEAHTFGTQFVCPRFRSFPDFAKEVQMYQPFDVIDAISTLEMISYDDEIEYATNLSGISDLGRRLEAHIMVNGIDHEVNIWHEYEYCKHLVEGNNAR